MESFVRCLENVYYMNHIVSVEEKMVELWSTSDSCFIVIWISVWILYDEASAVELGYFMLEKNYVFVPGEEEALWRP